MANIFSKLASGLTELVKGTIKLKSMRKEDLQQLLQDNISGHSRMETILANFSDKEMSDWYNKTVKPGLRNNNNQCKGVYESYLKVIRGKAAGEERKRPLGSLLEANASFAKLLGEISNKIDYLFDNDSVDIFNVRMSHIAILGLMRQSEMVLNFSAYLYSFMSRVDSRSAVSIPKYRDKFLVERCDRVATIVSLLLDKKGPYNFLREVDTIRKKNADLVLGATGRFQFTDSVVNSNYTPSFLDNLASALSCLNIFGAALDAWDDYRLAKYERNKEIKEWLETHVTLLRMDLADVDKTSPEYMKLVAIIRAYDDKIADYDKDILAFERED